MEPHRAGWRAYAGKGCSAVPAVKCTGAPRGAPASSRASGLLWEVSDAAGMAKQQNDASIRAWLRAELARSEKRSSTAQGVAGFRASHARLPDIALESNTVHLEQSECHKRESNTYVTQCALSSTRYLEGSQRSLLWQAHRHCLCTVTLCDVRHRVPGL